jgi:predicted molibdopterin-dependent oxidoreductase YjgC
MTFGGRDYMDASDIMDEIAALTPIYGGMSFERLEGVGLQWPCPDSEHAGTKFLHQGMFSRGKGKFHPVEFLEPKELPDREYPFIFTTGRQLEHWHTGTMSRRCEVLDDLVPHGLLEMHPEDGDRLGFAGGELARVSSRRGSVQVPVKIMDKTKPGTVFLAFHFREHPANALTIAALDPLAKIPEFKACAVKIERMGC